MPRHTPIFANTRRALLLLPALLGAAVAAQAADAPPVRIGYTMPATGPWAAGAQGTQAPGYLFWAAQLNAEGGLDVKGVRRKIELISLDDRSDTDTVVRTYVKLMSVDKVDLVLPPWGTNASFAVAPLAVKYGYPMVTSAALSTDLIKKAYPYFFVSLPQADRLAGAAVAMLAANGIKSVAMIYMDETMGLTSKAAFEAALKGTGIQLVASKAVALGASDLSGVLRSIKDQNPDAFVAFTYPGETILATQQAKQIGFTPKVFYGAIGTAFPFFAGLIGPGVEGITGFHGVGKKSSPEAGAFFDAFAKQQGKPADNWGGPNTQASLQVLQQAVAAVGLDRKALRDYIAKTEFKTVAGTVKFKGSENIGGVAGVGQWQNGEYEVVWPKAAATAQLKLLAPAAK